MANVELYSESARFIMMEFEIAGEDFEFYCMVDKKEVILSFFREVE